MSIFYYVPALLGILFIALGTWHGWRLRALTRHCTVPAQGMVVQFDAAEGRKSNVYYPVIRYAAGLRQYTERYAFGNTEWSFAAGDTVDIRYNPDKPEEFYLDHEQSVWRQYASPFMIIVGGLIFIATYYITL